MATTTSTTDFHREGDPRFTESVATFNLSRSLHPAGAATVRSVAQVRDLVLAAASVGSPVAPMSTGHRVGLMSDHPDLHLIRTELDDDIAVDPVRQTITFPAGARWGKIVGSAAAHGFAVPHGSSPTVGAVGYLLGGGISFYGRAWGVAANSIQSLRMVVADGTELTVDADTDPDLFWAVRGGGGGFGVVTSITLRMTKLDSVVTGMTVWPAEHAAGLLEAWRQWTTTAPSRITTSFRVMNLPPLPGLPPQMTGGQIVVIDGISVPDADDIDPAERAVTELVDRLSEVALPSLNTWHVGPPTDATTTHADPLTPIPAVGDSFSITDFTASTAHEWLSIVGPGGGVRVLAAELRQLGGAFRAPSQPGGAFDRLDADILVFTVDVLADPADKHTAEARVRAPRVGLPDHVGPWTAPTFTEDPSSPRRSFDELAEARVERVRRRIDPNGLFREDVRGSRS